VNQKDVVTIGVQLGDKESDLVVMPHIVLLRRLFNETMKCKYSDEIEEFSLLFRVDGTIWHWEFEGCERMRYRKKEKYITVDIGIPIKRWLNNSSLQLKEYIVHCIKQAFQKFIEKFKKDKINFKEEKLLKDVTLVLTKFMEIN